MSSEFQPPRALPQELDSPAWLHGLSAFTTIRTQRGCPLLWSAHLARLSHTCAFLGLPEPSLPAEAVLAQLEPLPEGRLRLTVTGEELWWSHRPLVPVPRVPVSVWLGEVQVHAQLGRHKTGNYLPYVLAAREASRHGTFESWLVDEAGCVVDGSRTSLLVEVQGELLIPWGGLPGVTCAELLRAWRRPARRDHLSRSVLMQVERAWITGSGIGVLPVRELRWAGGGRELRVVWPDVTHPALQPPQ
ncbi:aminotransferase class IV [Deinococcus peraridilitoris]|uniref:Branched-chain amino acid aminotransferase/4-amino-4-deoxychorismate lyase n=1 Tax=Deinococcus peraridilitoris (strain DSM 19664 / LMG 22246 / CIP 109416 / KR-200) TaxID=937777 RepID=L0A4D5_DEIPD|nr:aminotransferase class IV [Deinococcus peraridilitoris]AFZ68701.1 branched-chain amino acid aminotransferase/4-amino-4-deoxychorismate lyase [Deinococcus peraridilitoris DSM 19664]